MCTKSLLYIMVFLLLYINIHTNVNEIQRQHLPNCIIGLLLHYYMTLHHWNTAMTSVLIVLVPCSMQ